MNYSHAFHAGNFADVVKHAVLVRILVHLAKKPTPFRVIDTHAGAGLYDLGGDEATRTGEWRDGVGRLGAINAGSDAGAVLAPYRALIEADLAAMRYPGSPGDRAAPAARERSRDLLRDPGAGARAACAGLGTRPAGSRCWTSMAGRRWAPLCRRPSGAASCWSIRHSRRPTSLPAWRRDSRRPSPNGGPASTRSGIR